MKSKESEALLTPAAWSEAQAPGGRAGRIPIPMYIGIETDTMAVLYARPGGVVNGNPAAVHVVSPWVAGSISRPGGSP